MEHINKIKKCRFCGKKNFVDKNIFSNVDDFCDECLLSFTEQYLGVPVDKLIELYFEVIK